MRFIVQVDANWQVKVTTEGGNAVGTPRALRRINVPNLGDFPAPPDVELPNPAEPHYELCKGENTPLFEEALDDLAKRPVPAGAGDTFGQYLFATLLGAATWDAILQVAFAASASTIELALLWHAGESALHRLYWELMKNGNRFLAAGAKFATGNPPPNQEKWFSVAITRLVPRDDLEAVKLEHPPRVLYVVGASQYDQRIRPATEILGLLRRVREDGRALRWRVLANAKPSDVRDAVKSFRPQVVHFICHGDLDMLDGGRGYLELQRDEEDATDRRKADDLVRYLTMTDPKTSKEILPPIVVLSACYTAGTGSSAATAAGGDEVSRMGGTDKAGPLAADLVQQGIPVVIGMGGSVTDVACRLFTQRLVDALVAGETIVAAAETARRATFFQGANPHGSIDWALPTIFMAKSVQEEYAPIIKESQDATQQIASWIFKYGLEDEPIFCGRDEFFEAFNELFFDSGPGDRPRYLAVRAKDQTPGLGRRRLLKELAKQAFLAGHIPILLMNKTPQTLEAFVREMGDEVGSVSKVLGVTITSRLKLLRKLPNLDAQLDKEIADELGYNNNQLTPLAVRYAMVLDLKQLIAEAQGKHAFLAGVTSRAVVLLHRVDKYGALAADLLDPKKLMDSPGFGWENNPAPVVMTLSLGGENSSLLNDRLEEAAARKWLVIKELAPFREQDEEMLAYEWVLMNPLKSKVPLDGISNRAWARSVSASANDRKAWAGFFRRVTQGLPIRLTDREFYSTASIAEYYKFLLEAKDSDFMEKLQQQKWPS